MKTRLPALAGALLLFLSGCSSMLNREYSSSTPHVDYPVGSKSAVLQAENHQGLINAILYFVTEHQDTGIIHLSNYSGDVESALDAACREVCTEDPLGAYAVSEITYTHSFIVSYYEVSISITYAHTLEEVSAIVPAAGSTAIRQTISVAMSSFASNCVMRLSYFTGDEASLTQLARQTLLDTPLAALVRPSIRVSLYPDSGTSRIAEFSFLWPRNPEFLLEQRTALEQQALSLIQSIEVPTDEKLTPEALLTALRQTAQYDPKGAATAYAALVEGRGNDQGIALALRLLCQLADLEATVVEGRQNGSPRYWLILATPSGYRHLDPIQTEPACAVDEEFSQAGYVWDTDRYTPCADYAATGQPNDEESPKKDGENPDGDEDSGEAGQKESNGTSVDVPDVDAGKTTTAPGQNSPEPDEDTASAAQPESGGPEG